MFIKISNLITPKKLWILRLYVALLKYLVEFILVIYVALSLYNLLAQDNAFGDLILGYTGLYLVWICLAILFVAQVVSLFLNIHDSIEDVRNKAIDPDFSIDVASDKVKNNESSYRALVTIISIILAIILSFVNLNRENNRQLIGGIEVSDEQADFVEEYQPNNTNEQHMEIKKELVEEYGYAENWIGYISKPDQSNGLFGSAYNLNKNSIVFDGVELYLEISETLQLQEFKDGDKVVFSGDLVFKESYPPRLIIQLRSITKLN